MISLVSEHSLHCDRRQLVSAEICNECAWYMAHALNMRLNMHRHLLQLLTCNRHLQCSSQRHETRPRHSRTIASLVYHATCLHLLFLKPANLNNNNTLLSALAGRLGAMETCWKIVRTLKMQWLCTNMHVRMTCNTSIKRAPSITIEPWLRLNFLATTVSRKHLAQMSQSQSRNFTPIRVNCN